MNQNVFNDLKKLLIENIINAPVQSRLEILNNLHTLIAEAGLPDALLALYQQQVKSGFVLIDYNSPQSLSHKEFYDPNTGITFRVAWTPEREMRKDLTLLKERGIIDGAVDEIRLINKDSSGKPCLLCPANIELQNPREILLELNLAGKKYYIGANFAPISKNHFTIINAKHRPQYYHKMILKALIDFVDLTHGNFRSIFNGSAGSSNMSHEHLQATTEAFPIENIRIQDTDTIRITDQDLRVIRPKYYLPVILVEGAGKEAVADQADRLIRKWHTLDPLNHTENIICLKSATREYRVFIILRDVRKLTARGKKSGMAAFEAGGHLVLSYQPDNLAPGEADERQTFETATLDMVKQFLMEIAPEAQFVI
ncbi:MAG: DUF4922 domain-containing protein [Firmicutes bacterium]|nr:DUF4922 domain-containing protein [Bacillota bacterium]